MGQLILRTSVVSTPVADGDSITRTFSGTLGTWPVSGQEFLGGINGPVNGLSAGSTFRSLGRANWSYQAEDSKASAFSYTGYKSLLNDTLNDTIYQFGQTFDTGARYYAAFARCYIYLDTSTASPIQLKTIRFTGSVASGGGVSDADQPNIYHASYWGGAGGYFAVNGGSSGTQFTANKYNQGVWCLIEYGVIPDSSAGAGNASIRARCIDCSTGTELFNDTFSAKNIWGAGQGANPFRYLVAQLYMGNYAGGANVKTYYDDLYFAWNSSSATAVPFILIGDASTYAACNKRTMSICKYTAQSGNNITFTVNKGALSSLSGAYAYAMNGIDNPFNSTGEPL